MIKRDHSIKLTLALYKVTDLLPDNEPLKYKIRDKADDILTKLILANPNEEKLDREGLLEDIKIINAYFDIAQEQEWINPLNFRILKNEYKHIADIVNNDPPKVRNNDNKMASAKKEIIPSEKEVFRHNLSSRQRKLVDILKNKGPMRLRQVHVFFPQLNERTLRRDFNFLISKDIVKRIWQGKHIFYQLVS